MSDKILVVDDDLDSLKLISMMLQRQGYQIATANNGAQALQTAADQLPDLILLDIMMPDMDGYEVARRLRADSQTTAIPIIMFTAKTMVDDKVAGYEAGTDDYITKPAHPAELVSRIKILVNRSTRQAAISPTESGRIVSIIGVKGGTGSTTVALNSAIAMSDATTKGKVVLAEICPGQGTLGLHLGIGDTGALGRLAGLSLEQLSASVVESELVDHSSGIQLLLASPAYDSQENRLTSDSVQALARHLASICNYLVLDLGSGLSPIANSLVTMSDHVIVCLESDRISIELAQHMLAELRDVGVTTSAIGLVQVNRTQSDLQMSWQSVQQALGKELSGIISPASDLAYQAFEAKKPMIAVEPNSVFAGQLRKLGQDLIHTLGAPEPEMVGEGE